MPDEIIALYCDGGMIGRNPSQIGGTWAWCAINQNGERIIERGGIVPAPQGQLITNNHMEQIAITLALEAMPDGWSGTVYSDSMVALGRMFKGWKQKNLPANIAKRSSEAVARLGAIETVLLQGHPTKADLELGIGAKRNLPVSIHNMWCDKQCGKEARKYLKEREVECPK
jgi:ribonuclease HI